MMNFEEPYEILVDRLAHWIQLTIDYLPSALVALIVFLFFCMIAHLSSKLFRGSLSIPTEARTITRLIAFFTKMAIILLGGYFAIEILGFNEAIISLLAGAGIAGLVLGLAFQELITNLISGISLTIKKYFHLGDEVLINEHRGNVEALDLRATVLRGLDGKTIIIPNKDVLQSIVENDYTSGALRKSLFIGIPSSQNIEGVSEMLKEAVLSLDFLHKDYRTEILFIDLEEEIVKLELRYWAVSPIVGLSDRGEDHFALLAIKNVFDKYEMPLPVYVRNHEFKPELLLPGQKHSPKAKSDVHLPHGGH